jgi:hypothetical protein
MGILGTNDGFADGIEFVEVVFSDVTPTTSVDIILVMACFLQ